MRLLFAYQICSLGGVEAVLRNRLAGFRRCGVQPSVVLLLDRGAGGMFAGEASVHVQPSAAQLRRLIARGDFDVVSAIDTPQIYPVLRQAGFRGALVTEIHSNNMANLEYVRDLGATATRLVLTPSAFERELLLREFPALARSGIPLRVVPNPVDTERFAPRAPRYPAPRKLVGWVGRLEAQKNWPQFLEIAATVAALRNDVDFLLVGGWRTDPPETKDEFVAAVKDHGLIDRLQWVSRLPYERMPQLYGLLAASGGCLVPTSTFEPFGMTIIEAMASGCPVVAPGGSAFAELIDDGATGLIFASGRTEDAVRSVLRLLDDGGLRERLARAALARVREVYAAERVAARYLDVLRDELGIGGSAAPLSPG